MAMPKKPVTKKATKAKVPVNKKGSDNTDYGFGNVFANPSKKLAGPVGSLPKGEIADKKKGRPDRTNKGPVGAVFPIPGKAKNPRKAKAK